MVKNPPANAGDMRNVVRSPSGAMATHSSILTRRIPWTEEPGGIWSIGLQRVRHGCSDLALGSLPGWGRSPGGGNATHSSILAWRSISSHEQRSLAGFSPRGHKESRHD